jgi:hypothetical protein
MMPFEEIAEERRALKAFCTSHYSSVMHFSAGLSFYLNEIEDAIGPNDLRHITSSVTCYESLLACPERARESALPSLRIHPEGISSEVDDLPLEGKIQKFTDGILRQALDKWISDASARVYCECRSLPFAIGTASRWNDSIRGHIEHALKQLKLEPARAAIGEADPSVGKGNWYPPNAYHTFWILKALGELRGKFPSQYSQLERRLGLAVKIDRMRQWARQTLALQTTLHSADSSTLDTDQLAWSLAIAFSDPGLDLTKLSEQDFIREALRCLFTTQTKIGTWRHYAPLFHYKQTGNAYCYVFETFAALLECTLRPDARFLREALKGHCAELLRLWSYARATQSSQEGKIWLWSSGHRLNQTNSESWATASVFQYAQCLRRLVGIWTREEALRALPVDSSDIPQTKALSTLSARSATWVLGSGLTDRLFTLFVHPRELDRRESKTEPDGQPIGENHARSAILFGPPGASKTTMIRNLAAAIRWRYVELHSSHFVADGLPNVQKTADAIFRRLYELDHVVILFDEIDELVREREKEGEASGRFLTTSMLPKLAELWKNRKVLYFVATNHIEFFDKAITRAERFDAAWFVSPPSFDSKLDRLATLLRKRLKRTVRISLRKEHVEASFEKAVARARKIVSDQADGHPAGDIDFLPLEDSEALAKFMLLRWDELDELAVRLCEKIGSARSVNRSLVQSALGDVRDGRWRMLGEYLKFAEDQKFQRRDYGKINLWKVAKPIYRGLQSDYIKGEGTIYLPASAEELSEIMLPGISVKRIDVGTLRLAHKR